MGHPDLQIILQVIEQTVDMATKSLRLNFRMPIFLLRASNNVLAMVPCDFLQTIAYSEDWYAELEDSWINCSLY
jgi:hypothetical protein